MSNNKTIQVYQGLVRYKNVPKADQDIYELKKIEKYKVERIKDFTLTIPKKDNMIMVCKSICELENYNKIAEIFEENGKTLLRFEGMTSNLAVLDKAVGYIELNLFGITKYYETFIKAVPDYSEFDGVVAFVDGSSGGNAVVEYDGEKYLSYGGAYIFYENNNTEPLLSSKEEENPIDIGLKGISKNVGNIYGEINSVIAAIKRAEKEKINKLRIYYDCEQIGGNAPGGVNKSASTKITKKYMDFWQNANFQNLEYIELIHVDAHMKFDLNNAIDELAKEMRDAVKEEFNNDMDKQNKYLCKKNEYV